MIKKEKILCVETCDIDGSDYEKKNEKNYPVEDVECEVSIAVLAYNRVDKTKECVDSILKYTKNIKYKLYLIDNGSDDDTADFFESVNYADKYIIKITKNIGALYATNVLLKNVITKYLVLFMNDCMATSNWLENLKCCMESDNKIGLVCPISNNMSNFQNLDVPNFDNYEQMHYWAESYNKSNRMLWEERIRLIPVVGMYRREVFDTIGVMDLSYRHEFADDDYAIRLRRGGYKMIMCGDTYMPHNHTMAERAQTQTSEELSSKIGRELFLKKYHGIEPWEDMANFIRMYLPYDMEVLPCAKKILGIDVRCGTPILDMKNYFRKKGVEEVEADAFTTSAKYLIDLETLAERVETNTNVEAVSEYFEGEEIYDAVILGEPLNGYPDMKKALRIVNQKTKKGGIYLFSILNSNDMAQLLECFGISAGIDKSREKVLSEKRVLEWLEEFDPQKVTVNYEKYQYLPQNVQDFLGRLLSGVAPYIDTENTLQNLLNRKVWFTVQK